MTKKLSTHLRMRIWHRYLGFFLAGIMGMYAISGIVLIFRDTDTFKRDTLVSKEIKPNASEKEIGQLLRIKNLKVEREEGDKMYFANGVYDKSTGVAEYTVKKLPFILDKITHFHKAKSAEPLFFFNILFGMGLLFFVISAFWMYIPQKSILRKGIYFTLGGIALALIMLFV